MKVNEREICFVLHNESQNQHQGIHKLSPGTGSDMFQKRAKGSIIVDKVSFKCSAECIIRGRASALCVLVSWPMIVVSIPLKKICIGYLKGLPASIPLYSLDLLGHVNRGFG